MFNRFKIRGVRVGGCLLACMLFLVTGGAQAFNIPTGIDHLKLTLNNTVLVTLGMRVESPNKGILESPVGYYASDAKFDKWDLFTSRLTIKPKLSLVYEPSIGRSYGLVVSGNGWYDPSYSSAAVPVQPGAPGSAYDGNRYSTYINHWYRGPGAEMLDAFVFLNQKVAGLPVHLKAGKFTKVWGPGALLSGFETSVFQYPVDVRKALSQPGSTVSELFLPLAQVHFQVGLLPNLSVAFQYFFQYQPNRFPDGGTYFGGPGFVFNGPDHMVGSLVRNGGFYGPDSDDVNEWGLMAQWQPGFTAGTIGFYYRHYASKAPWVQLTSSSYRGVFPTGIELYGITLDRNIGPAAIGIELSYIHDAPLALVGLLGPGQEGPRGGVFNFDINAIYVQSTTRFYDSATWLAEIGVQHLSSVTTNASLFNGDKYQPGCDWKKGCATENAVQLAVNFTPEWYQVVPQVNLSLPISITYGLTGNAASLGAAGAAQGSLTASVGVEAQWINIGTATLAYTDSYAHTLRNASGKVIGGNGAVYLQDRGRVILTLKTHF